MLTARWASQIHDCINIKCWSLIHEARNWCFKFFSKLSNSFWVSVENANLLIREFISRLIYHGTFPITAWEEHVVGLDNLRVMSYWELNWLDFCHWRWRGDWFDWRIWGSNCNWKVGTLSLGHNWVAIISWTEWFFIIKWFFLFSFFRDFHWSRSFVE